MSRNKITRTLLLGLLPALLPLTATASAASPVPASASAVSTAPSSFDPGDYVCSAETNSYRYHPSEPGVFCHPVWGWGSWGEETLGSLPPGATGMSSRTPVVYTTPIYSSSSSYDRTCEASEIVGRPVALRNDSYLPTRITTRSVLTFTDCSDPDGPARRTRVVLPAGVSEFRVGCVDSDEAGKPCLHRNRWVSGPYGGWSSCDLTSCQTRGHQAQNGYEDFLAHYELWSNNVESHVLFNACGDRCNPPDCDKDPTAPDCTTCPPGSPGCPECPPATPNDCTPPPFCARFPENSVCRLDPIPGLHFEIRISVPDRFSAKGTVLSQGANVTSVELLCQDVPCLGNEPTVEASADSITGRLVIEGSGTYTACTSVRAVGCKFFTDRPDRSGSVVAGNLVGAVFFSPTRSGEKVFVRFDGLRATVDRYQMVPVLVRGQVSCAGVTASYCRGRRSYPDWVPSGELRRQFVRTDVVPVTVRDQAGNVMPSAGFPRPVIGTVGG